MDRFMPSHTFLFGINRLFLHSCQIYITLAVQEHYYFVIHTGLHIFVENILGRNFCWLPLDISVQFS